jgi:hypothetical protein
MSDKNNQQNNTTQYKGVVISIRVRDEDYPIIENIARDLHAQGQIKAPIPAALTKSALNIIICNQYLAIKKQQEFLAQHPEQP